MNFNSGILKVSIVMALVFMLIPIAAAEDQSIDEVSVIETHDDVSGDVLAQESGDVISEDGGDDKTAESSGGGEEYSTEYEPFISVPEEEDLYETSADLEIVSYVTPENPKVGDTAVFTFIVYNHGPDVAANVVAYANVVKGDVLYLSSMCEQGVYDPSTGVWEIGDIEPDDYVMLTVYGRVVSDEKIVTMAYVTSDTPDPEESDNYYTEEISVEKSGNYYASESEKLPVAGNPVIMALLAFLAMAGVTLKKRD